MSISTTPAVSIVVPLYNEELSLRSLVEWIDKVCRQAELSYEVVLVDDGSDDNSWKEIERLVGEYAGVRALHFESNYGKSAALYEGFQSSKAAVIITMDADLQDSPDEIPALYAMIKEQGYDLVSGWKKKRHDVFTKRVYSLVFNQVVSWVSGIQLKDFNCGLKAYKAEAARSLYVYGDLHRYLPLLAYWMGYRRIGQKVVRHYPRPFGKSKYGWGRILHGVLDLFSIWFMVRFGRRPMHFFGVFGLLSFLLGGGIVLYLLIRKVYSLAYDLPFREMVDQPLFYISLIGIVIGVQCFLAAFVTEMLLFVVERKRKTCVDKALG